MQEKNKTLYLWDLAGTLFPEKWNKKTGFDSYREWIKNKLNKKIDQISDLEYEKGFEIPYTKGSMFNLELQKDFKKVLSWTKYNETFSTGNKEQMNWRAKYLNSKVDFDVLEYFQKLNSTFDYGNTNKKTKEMMIKYLKKRYNEGYKTVVYTDDKIKNLEFFREAGEVIKKKYNNFSYRLYHILKNKSGIKQKDYYFEVGGLIDLMNNEKILG